jgi:site-specific DNA-methyltransferase (adenine-specific)
MINNLFCDDCFNVLPKIDNKSIDLIICDPPYGSTPLKWDKQLDFNRLWAEYKRIIKDNGVILIFGQEPFSSYVRLSNIEWFKYDWYWQKERLTNVFQVKRRPGKVIETISVFYKNQPTFNHVKTIYEGRKVSNKIGENARFSQTMSANAKNKPLEYIDDGTRYPLQLLKINRDNCRKNIHPTQKPLELCEYFINTYTNEGNVVLDNCMGSGGTILASLKLNRQYIGIEKNNNYYNLALNRINQYKYDNYTKQ